MKRHDRLFPDFRRDKVALGKKKSKTEVMFDNHWKWLFLGKYMRSNFFLIQHFITSNSGYTRIVCFVLVIKKKLYQV